MAHARKRKIWRMLPLAAALAWGLMLPGGQALAGPFEEAREFFLGGHYRWALEKLIEAVDRAPQDPERQWYLAESYRLLGDGAAAAHAYRRILQVTPHAPHYAAAARQALEAMGEPTLVTTQVPFQRRGTAVLIAGKVNDQPAGLFILDTGATFTSLSRLVANGLGISEGSSWVSLATASGITQAPLTLLEELDVGGAVALHVPVVIHDLPNAPPGVVGLLGLSFLERFRISLDIASGILVLESGR